MLEDLRFMQEDMQENNLRELCRNQSQFFSFQFFLEPDKAQLKPDTAQVCRVSFLLSSCINL